MAESDTYRRKAMKYTAKKKIMDKIRKKLSGKRGFSLGELLAATIILLLASQVMTQGVAFAVRMYNESLTRSHGKMLCSTLTNAIETELRYTTSITVDSGGTLKNYFSPVYGRTQSSFSVIDENGNPVQSTSGGEVAIQITNDDDKLIWQKLISSASYSSYNLKARVESVIFDNGSNTFHVELHIIDKNGKKLVTNKFDVIAVNEVISTIN